MTFCSKIGHTSNIMCFKDMFNFGTLFYFFFRINSPDLFYQNYSVLAGTVFWEAYTGILIPSFSSLTASLALYINTFIYASSCFMMMSILPFRCFYWAKPDRLLSYRYDHSQIYNDHILLSLLSFQDFLH